MRIVFFGNATSRNAAIRYRVEHFAQMLEAEGHRVTVCLPSSAALWERLWEGRGRASKLLYLMLVVARRVAQLRHVPGADVVFFRGPVFPYGPTVFERIIHRINPRMVFDIDDAVWERPAYVESFFLRFQDFHWVFKMGRLCRAGVAGNRYLQERLAERGFDTVIIPTCVDAEGHAAKAYPPADRHPVVLGWNGLADNLGYLSVVENALRRLASNHDIELHIATVGKEYAIEGVRVVNRRWRAEDEFDYLQEPDIGLMPLTPSPRALGKCAFKALQFMAVGTPCVVSPVGMNADVIEDGVTGFLASSPEEWHDKLARLIEDGALREDMGRKAREYVLAHFTHKAHYAALKAVLEQAAGQR